MPLSPDVILESRSSNPTCRYQLPAVSPAATQLTPVNIATNNRRNPLDMAMERELITAECSDCRTEKQIDSIYEDEIRRVTSGSIIDCDNRLLVYSSEAETYENDRH